MKNIGVFVSENFQFLEVKFSIYLNKSVFVMNRIPHELWVKNIAKKVKDVVYLSEIL